MVPRVWFITGTPSSTALGSWALITSRGVPPSLGTSSGFGRRLVLSALARGDRVVATARSAEKLVTLAQGCPVPLRRNLRTMQLDVTEGKKSIEAKMDQAAQFWGTLDVVVNNAACVNLGLIEEGGTERFRTQFEPNLFGLLGVTLSALPHLRSRKGSTLVMIGSRSAFRPNLIGIGPYAASKAAVHALAETLTVELAPFGVRVLHVAPGTFCTEGIPYNCFYSENKLGDYGSIRNAAAKQFASVPGTERGDPAKAMEVLVDVVRGEGVAKGRPWPGFLALGEDSERDIRKKCETTLRALDEWKDVALSVNLDSRP